MNDTEHDGSFLAINELRLDQECLGQAKLYFDYSTQLADAKALVDEAKTNLEIVEAELSASIRSKPTKFDLPEKPTEAAIKVCIVQQEEFRVAQKRLSKRMHKAGILQAAVAALDQRKRMLVLLVDLYGLRYFADPQVAASGETREALSDAGKKETRKLGRLKRNKLDDEEDDS